MASSLIKNYTFEVLEEFDIPELDNKLLLIKLNCPLNQFNMYVLSTIYNNEIYHSWSKFEFPIPFTNSVKLLDVQISFTEKSYCNIICLQFNKNLKVVNYNTYINILNNNNNNNNELANNKLAKIAKEICEEYYIGGYVLK